MDKKQRGTSKQERTKDFLSTKDYVIVRKITKKKIEKIKETLN